MSVAGYDLKEAARMLRDGLGQVADAIKYHADVQMKVAQMQIDNPSLSESEWIAKP